MFDIAGSLMNALNATRDGLASAASNTAKAQTRLGVFRPDGAMADVAQRAIFTEALMNAMHSRLAELKSVTHG
jgi:hypothetical protein